MRGSEEEWLWLDQIAFAGPGLGIDAGLFRAAWWGGVFVTESIGRDTRYGFAGAMIARNITFETYSGDPVGDVPYVVNVELHKFDQTGVPMDHLNRPAFHGDVWQFYTKIGGRAATENLVLSNIFARAHPTQGIFLQEPGGGNKKGKFVGRFGGLALVDIEIITGGQSHGDSQLAADLDALYVRNWHVDQDIKLGRSITAADVAGLTARRVFRGTFGDAAIVRGLRILRPDLYGAVSMRDLTRPPAGTRRLPTTQPTTAPTTQPTTQSTASPTTRPESPTPEQP